MKRRIYVSRVTGPNDFEGLISCNDLTDAECAELGFDKEAYDDDLEVRGSFDADNSHIYAVTAVHGNKSVPIRFPTINEYAFWSSLDLAHDGVFFDPEEPEYDTDSF